MTSRILFKAISSNLKRLACSNYLLKYQNWTITNRSIQRAPFDGTWSLEHNNPWSHICALTHKVYYTLALKLALVAGDEHHRLRCEAKSQLSLSISDTIDKAWKILRILQKTTKDVLTTSFATTLRWHSFEITRVYHSNLSDYLFTNHIFDYVQTKKKKKKKTILCRGIPV